MRKYLIGAALAALAAVGVAMAQVNTVPQVGLITSYLKNSTYASTTLALAPASSATDVACISGSTTREVHLTRIAISGTAGTLVTLPVTLLLRHSLDTGGTAGTTTANWANNKAPLNTSDVASTATLISYSANPTITDTSPTYIRTGVISLNTTAALVAAPPLTWLFGNPVNVFDKEPTIPAATTVVKQFCLNFNGVSVSTGVLNLDVEWQEK